jgi:hypothetical protein
MHAAFSVATNGDLATSTKYYPAAITRIGVAAALVLKAWGQESFCFTAANKKCGNEDCRSSD